MTDEELDRLIEAQAVLLGLGLHPEWREAVRANLQVTLRFGAMVEAFDLPDEAEPAPVFSA
ncbi:DUF4089 domain-containing protein [Pseudoroseomonas deserti]|uniref:DUF4089 domain-containing protein n=1 Tax=Teichococcus deserti TaxID=1817963 RepID=A0A1V2GYR2_9PROT|nr:DUF4089 domain-containing protein [Pseudoroseomonas deserti]ONG50368.1 DUF4089 domain-containing protein [Pseudoroseomonas deserti]